MRVRYSTSLVAAWMLAATAFLNAAPAFAQITESSDELIAILQSADADLHAKAVACKKLAVVGDAKAVPVLAELLTDPKLSHYARFGLEPNPSPAADEALRAALDKVEGRLLAGVINSIGVRKDAGAIDKLKELSASDDPQVVSAVAHALGQIASVESANVLKEM
ncbi:MAG: HEAT repeat domain-containing protein, partial [Planctomycetota bacterium]